MTWLFCFLLLERFIVEIGSKEQSRIEKDIVRKEAS
jgi:hypothetical protein